MELKIAGRRVKQREKAEALSPGQRKEKFIAAARPEGAEALSPGLRKEKSNSLQQHALKGQKLLAQGNAKKKAIHYSSTPCFTLIEQALSAFFNVNYV